MLLIPSIDLRAGRCVRLLQGDFAAETRYQFEPLELLQRYRELGAPWLHVVDLDGARDGLLANRSIIATLATQPGIALQVGGGVRSREVVADLLQLGVGRVVVGSAAVEAADAVAGWLAEFGAERLCLAFDVRLDAQGLPLLRTRGWRQATTLSLWDCVQRFLPCGLRHVLCTDIERDGALRGPNLALYREAAARYPQLRWQASGGVADTADLHALAAVGVAAAVSGKALLEERLPAEGLQPFLRAG
jgi:phosphoribosylformimino-5-aminoimidazole carboxamide ribotide isomerase